MKNNMVRTAERTFKYGLSWLTGVCAVAGFALGSWPAQAVAVTITFDSLTQPGTGNGNVPTPYIESGFQFAADNVNGFAFWQTGSPHFPGSTALFNDTGGGITTLTQVGGGEFSITSIALMGLTASNGSSQTLTFIGTLADNSTVTQTFIVPATGPTVTQNLFFFTDPGFLAVTSVTFAPQNEPFYQFDNITVNPVNAVPESGATLALMFGSVAMLFGLRRVWRQGAGSDWR